MKVINYNTHLFGDSLPPAVIAFAKTAGIVLQFEDSARTLAIVNQLRIANADIVGLTEVWDDALANRIVSSLIDLYHFSFRPNQNGIGKVLGSGLLLLSKWPLRQASFTPFTDLSGFDALSTKGVVSTLVNLPGDVPPLALVFAHTQADTDSVAVTNRHANLVQMQYLAAKAKLDNPRSSVLLLGDLNVIGEIEGLSTTEYQDTVGVFGAVQLKDVFRQLHPSPAADPGFTYDGVNNSLIRLFAPSDANSRQRIDYQFFAANQASGIGAQSLIVSTDFRNAVGDLSDHYPMIGEYSGA